MNKQCEHYNIQINRTIKIQHTSDVSVTWEEGYIESFHLNWNEGTEVSTKNSISVVILCKDCGKVWSINVVKRNPTEYAENTPEFIKRLLQEEEERIG